VTASLAMLSCSADARIANASPVIVKAYETDEISLEQLMTYCPTDNNARQEQVFEALTTSYNNGHVVARSAAKRASAQCR
jgi:hypothetical protein